jgi:hypothetical protein
MPGASVKIGDVRSRGIGGKAVRIQFAQGAGLSLQSGVFRLLAFTLRHTYILPIGVHTNGGRIDDDLVNKPPHGSEDKGNNPHV